MTHASEVKEWPDYAALIDAVPALVWSCRPDGTLEYVNRWGLEYLGRTFADIANWDWVSVVHPDDLAMVGEKWSAALESGEPYEIHQMRFLRAETGRYHPFTGRARALRDASGKILRWAGSHMETQDSRA